jgi:hypothetical protein
VAGVGVGSCPPFEKMNPEIGRIIVVIARGIAWVIEQIIKKK